MRNPRNYFIIGLASAIFVMASYLFIFPEKSEPQSHVITLEEGGFTPADITIARGDMITFKTVIGKEFWPASDLHPTHGVYPEFDPRQPVSSDTVWIFRFNKIGTWKYHDHLNPRYRGEITVVEKKAVSAVNISFCQKAESKFGCWEELMTDTLNSRGLDAAFDVISELYSTEPAFASECHGYVHKLGEDAYEKFARNEDIDLTPKTSYCGYGFYHGFMETLLHSGGDIDQAKEFCAYADRQLAKYTSKTIIACYHGIGHGAVDGSDPRAWGDPRKLIAPGLEICEKLADDERTKYLCGSGVYNSLAIALNGGQYELKPGADPYDVCHALSEPYFKRACYEEMNTRAMMMGGNDISRAVVFSEKVRDEAYAIIAVENLSPAAVAMAGDGADLMPFVLVCRNLQREALRLPCLGGIVGGSLEYGKPGLEYERALKLCGSEGLSFTERAHCYETLVGHANTIYPADKVIDICNKTGNNKPDNCPR